MERRNYLFSVLLLAVLASAGHGAAEDLEPQRSITLKEAVELALLNNLSLRLQKEEVESARGAALRAEGKFDIFFEADAGVQNEELTPLTLGGAEQEDTGIWNIEATKIFTSGTSVTLGWNNNSFDSDSEGLLFNPSHNSGLNLSVQQPLLKGFGKKIQTAELRAAKKQLQATTYEVNDEAANLSADVKRAYWNFVFAWQDIKVQELSLELAEKLLEETNAKIEAGKLAPVEIYQPQSEVARRQEELISAERAIGVAEDDLKLLLNSKDWLTIYEPTDYPTTQLVELDLPTILENALRSRPDLKASDLATEAAKIELARSEDEIRPDLSLTGGVGVGATESSYGDALDNSLTDPDNRWQLGLNFSLPLSNATAKGSFQQAKASYAIARTNGELLRQQVRRSVRTTIRDVRLAIKALEATRKTSLATKKRLEAEQAKFDSGRSTTLDVLTAQEAYSEALSQENLTKISYANTLAEIDRIQGLVTLQ